MSQRWVLDASAAIHLALRAPDAESLLEVLEKASVVIAPALYGAETANALWKYVRAGQIERETAMERWEEAARLVDRMVPDADLLPEALAVASHQGHPVYDALYGVLARRHDCGVITRDRRLADLLMAMGVPSTG